MRKMFISALMISLMLLCGCSRGYEGKLEEFRSAFAEYGTVSFVATMTVQDENSVADYTVECVRTGEETVLRLVEPELISGVTAHLKGKDVLIVYDTESVYHFGHSLTGDLSDVHNSYNQFDMADAIAKSGAGYDMIFLYDLQKCDLSRYKCVLFVACEKIRKTDYEYIQSNVMKDGRTVAFMRQNGYIVDGNTSKENIEKLYGTKKIDAYFEEVRNGCKVVGIPEFAYDKNFYRDLFAGAGAHIYAKGGEVTCVGNGYLAVHTKDMAQTTLYLPCGEKTLALKDCETIVFDLQTGERVLG